MYKNCFGLDRKIVSKVLDEAVKCRRHKIDITTFMIARDPYLQEIVKDLTEANNGRAYYSSLSELGGNIFEDYIRNRKKRFRYASFLSYLLSQQIIGYEMGQEYKILRGVSGLKRIEMR